MTPEDSQTHLSKEKVMKTFNSKNIALAMVATMGVALFAVGAHAAEASPGVDSRAVHYADLNLNTAAGAKVLYMRIRMAAGQVCGDAGSRQLEQAAAAKACLERAIRSSIRAVNSVQLARVANEHGYPVEISFNVATVR
jgi:UrcA family protein